MRSKSTILYRQSEKAARELNQHYRSIAEKNGLDPDQVARPMNPIFSRQAEIESAVSQMPKDQQSKIRSLLDQGTEAYYKGKDPEKIQSYIMQQMQPSQPQQVQQQPPMPDISSEMSTPPPPSDIDLGYDAAQQFNQGGYY